SIMRPRSGEIFSGESFMALLRLQTRRIASPCNIRNRTSDLSFSRTPKRNHPYRASGLVLRPSPARHQWQLWGSQYQAHAVAGGIRRLARRVVDPPEIGSHCRTSATDTANSKVFW